MEDEVGMLLAREDPSSVGVLLFSPSPDPARVQTKLQPTFHFSDIAMHTLFLENNNTMFKILKERNGWIGVALSFISNASSVK